MSSIKGILNNSVGAFSDIAVMIPLIALLTQNTSYVAFNLFASIGVVYIVSSLLFRVPISVQPLKSIVVAALTIGASIHEVKIAGLLLGLTCLMILLFKFDRILKLVPDTIVHQIQIGLGVLLVIQALKSYNQPWLIICALSAVLIPLVSKLPIIGIVAMIAFGSSFFVPMTDGKIKDISNSNLNWATIVILFLPQVILTLSNSVIATEKVCKHYFKENAKNVSVKKLLFSIGIGNILMPIISGLPFCHGSGGVTAHVKGGSTHFGSTIFMGVIYLILSIFYLLIKQAVFTLPAFIVSFLLMVTGLHHIALAKSTYYTKFGFVQSLTSVLIAMITQNLLWVLGFAIVFEIIKEKVIFTNQKTA